MHTCARQAPCGRRQYRGAIRANIIPAVLVILQYNDKKGFRAMSQLTGATRNPRDQADGETQCSGLSPTGLVVIWCVYGLIALGAVVYAAVGFVASPSEGKDLDSIDSVTLMVVAVGATVAMVEIVRALMGFSKKPSGRGPWAKVIDKK